MRTERQKMRSSLTAATRKPVEIGSDVWVGGGAIILPAFALAHAR